MKLVFISGSPASWKLTIAKQLSKIIDFWIYHNHLAHDLVVSILKHETHRNTIKRINLIMISEAVKEQINWIINTNCFVYPDDLSYVKKIIDIVNKWWWEVNFVHIICETSKLIDRVVSNSRKQYWKINDKNTLLELLSKKNFSQVPYVNSLIIDNSNISPLETAKMIKNHYKL
jgi:hypothetical protein